MPLGGHKRPHPRRHLGGNPAAPAAGTVYDPRWPAPRTARGLWRQVRQVILNWLGDLDAIDWSRACLDSISIRAKRGGEHTALNRTDRGKAGTATKAMITRPVAELCGAVRTSRGGRIDARPGRARSARGRPRRPPEPVPIHPGLPSAVVSLVEPRQ